MFGIRKKIKSTIKQLLHLEESMPQHSVVEPEVSPKKETPPEPKAEPPVVEAPQEDVVEEVKAEKETISTQENVEEASPRVIQAVESTQTAGKELTVEAVQEILDDDIRPALQSDGGDITLIKIEDISNRETKIF